jgi:tRNA pseudouridine55 synthase
MRHGFLLVDKPADMTSHDVVAIVRRQLGERGIGHLGTLDPAATGLLVLAVGKKALKVVQLFGDLSKEYEAHVQLGAVSTTYDADGVIEDIQPLVGWEPPEQAIVQRLIADRFIGKVSQVPPAYSAIKIGGERAYRKAMRGEVVDMPSREVEIKKCQILSYAYPYLELLVSCGSGTYIRSLAHDLGKSMGCGGYLMRLRRTKVGEWTVEGGKPPEEAVWTDVFPLKEVLVSFPRRDLTNAEFDDLTHGRNIEAEVEMNTIGWINDLPVVLLIPAPDGTAHAKRVF